MFDLSPVSLVKDDEEDSDEDDDMDFEGKDVELRLARLEHLMERRPLLLSSVRELKGGS